jgi:hypothetical protein
VSDADALAASWAEALAAWAIPQPILDAAPASPYGFPTELFVRRAERAGDPGRTTPTIERAAEALDALGAPGALLDVGAGGGATSRPLWSRCARLVAVDGQPDMLEALRDLVGPSGVELTTIVGRWPDVAGDAPGCDVAVCGHVAYNAPDLDAFVLALTAHARRRVVLELTDRHPLWWMRDLWMRFHGIDRPDGPTADDAATLCASLGLDVGWAERLDGDDVAGGGFPRREDAVALVRRRLCLSADRDDEIAEALGPRLRERGGLWRAGPTTQRVVTLWWDVGPA